MNITLTETCRDCGGSGEDYAGAGGNMRTVACHSCGGNGFIEVGEERLIDTEVMALGDPPPKGHPDRDDWEDYDDDPGECFECGGEGVVWSCFDDMCVGAEDGCEDCTYECPECRRRKRDRAAQDNVPNQAVAPGHNGGSEQ